MAQWELNYEDREAIRKVIVARCAQTVRKYALYLLSVPAPDPITPLYTAQVGWAREAIRNVFGLGEQLSHYVTSDSKFVAGAADGNGNVTRQGGSSIPDADLTGVIENAINTHFIVVPE